MSKTSTDLVRHALNGPTMGTRWSALFFTENDFDPESIQAAFQAAVEEVDVQMSTWKPDSEVMRLNAASVGEWLTVPTLLQDVLRLGLEIGKESGGAFDIGMGDAVSAWGFGPNTASQELIRAAMSHPRTPAYETLELDAVTGQVRKRNEITLDLNGIAKGFGTDRLAETLKSFGINSGLVGIDGEMCAHGLKPGNKAWTVAVESPDPERRAPHSILSLQDAAVATSGDYRHWVDVQGHRLSHTMNPRKGAPLVTSPASVTVVARTCAEADAWATTLMVLGEDSGAKLARQLGLDALFLVYDDDGCIRDIAVGPLFSNEAEAIAST